jgi:hypothetical protein
VASYHAIHAVGQAIIGLLSEARAGRFPNADFQLYQPSNFQEPMKEGISLFLYRVTVNLAQRNQPYRPPPGMERARKPLPLDLYYLMTAWAQTPEQQQLLLGWAMRKLEDIPVLPSGFLNHYGAVPNVFRPTETVEFIYDTLSLQDLVNIWDVFKPHQQLSVTYVARMVAIESEMGVPDAGPVQTRVFEFGGKESEMVISK